MCHTPQVTLEVQWDEGGQPAPGALAALAAAEARMAEELPEVLTTGCECCGRLCSCSPVRTRLGRPRSRRQACARQMCACPRLYTRPALPCPGPACLPDINYLDVDLDRWQALARYAGPNAARLVAVKRRYDPHNFFRNPWSVPLTLEPPSAAVAAEDARQREQPGGA